MDLIDFIGFIITFFIFIFLIVRRSIEKWKRRNLPEPEEEEVPQGNEEQLKEFLKSLEWDMEETEKKPVNIPPPLPPKPIPQVPQPQQKALKPVGQFSSHVEHRGFTPAIEKRKLESKITERPAVTSKKFSEIAEADPYHLRQRRTKSRIRELLGNLKNKQDLVIFSEIVGRPKSMR